MNILIFSVRLSYFFQTKEWLQAAISEFTSNDEVTLIKKCLEVLAKPRGTLSSNEEEDLMTRENALEQLETVVDIIHNANGED